MLEIVDEAQCAVWTRRFAHLAERTTAEVVDILVEFTFFLAVRHFYHLGNDLNCTVRATHLAKTATDAFVVAVFVINQLQRTAKALTDVEVIAIVRIFFRYFFGKKFLTGDTHSFEEACDTLSNSGEVFFYTTHI